MQLYVAEKKGFGIATKDENDPEVKLQKKIDETYGELGKIDLYN